MNYSLLVLSSPGCGSSAHSALAFARAVVARGHHLERVFFMDEGVYAGSAARVAPQDESDLVLAWATLREEYQVDLVVCVSSAIKRGLLNSAEADRHEKIAATLHPAFEISGLGQLVDASSRSDRLLTFGG